MRILLFGEFSGLFNCLKEGLEAIGHEVYLVSDGNGYKNYPSDFRYDIKLPKFLRKFSAPINYLNLWLHRKLLKGYDVVYFMDPSIISRHVSLNAPLYRYMIKHNKASFLCGAGDTALMVDYWIHSNEKYKNYVQGIINNQKETGSVVLYPNKELEKWEDELLNSIDGYIPIWYEYAQPFRNYSCLEQTVRIPIPVDNFEYRPNVVRGKVVFFHGVSTREEAKGTPYIKEAFKRMEKKYGDVAEFICVGGLPFDEYMALVSRINVILDDANSYSIAMNGLFALSMGKIVMGGGAEPEGNEELGISNVNPVINIEPNVDQICSQIEYIIHNREKIEEWGCLSRKFVEEYHNPIDIAKKYSKIFIDKLNNCYEE